MSLFTRRPSADACTTLLPNISFAAFGTVPRISAAVATIAATLLPATPVAAQTSAAYRVSMNGASTGAPLSASAVFTILNPGAATQSLQIDLTRST